ncbi:MAG TPA: dihydrodipicolinate synthase family protein [Chloroflexota bacterium]
MSATPLEPGVWAILATPFRGPEVSVDAESLRTMVRMYREAGVTGLVALGVLGEASRLSTEERREVLSTVIDEAAELPVVAGMAALSAAPAIEEARRAAEAGARAVMVQVPTPDPEKLARHFGQIADASGLGIVIQDHPAASGVVIQPVALARAAALAGCVVGIKAEAPPIAPAIAAVVQEIDLPMFGGLGGVGLLDELLVGSAGAMTGFAVPEALVATLEAWHQHGYEGARRTFLPWLPLVLFEAQEKISLALRKEILRRRGAIREAAVRPPGVPMPPSLAPILDAHLAAVPLPSAVPA